MDKITFKVEGMSCMHCVGAVKKAVSALDGVSGVEVDLKGKTAEVVFDKSKLSQDTIKKAIEEQGYDVI